ncbi:MAG TPA: hypothetical protein VH157_11080 [Bryobacteraceae bacterium]|nr:hypothetical protein [Bryobacteraceae bacterium]
MFKKLHGFTLTLMLLAPASTEAIAAEITAKGHPLLWVAPSDIQSRNLFYGPGGKDHEPHGTFTFTKEDLDGTSPKFFVRDQDGVKWKVKLGSEARPETVASRLTWAVGYFANEDYFVSQLHLENLPPHLHRGQKMVASDGTVPNVRLKRYLKGEEKVGTWQWSQSPFAGTRELNGLRVMMALLNNWDLTDENNAMYDLDSQQIYMVTDLGSTFGPGRLTWPLARSRGNLGAYRSAKFITKTTPNYVDFQTPSRPSIFFLLTPREFAHKLHLRWIGRRIPRSDAKWIGQLLAQLSPQQIRDAFRAAGYSAPEVEGFAHAVESRIAQLQEL